MKIDKFFKTRHFFSRKIVVICATISILSACSPSGKAQQTSLESTSTIAPISTTQETITPVSYANDISPIFQENCIKCHGGERISAGLDLSSYSTVISGSRSGAVIIPGDAETSKLVSLIRAGRMPKNNPSLSSDQIKLIESWVNSGALDN